MCKNIVKAVVKSVVVLVLALSGLAVAQSSNTQSIQAARVDNYKTVYENINGGAGLYRDPFLQLEINRDFKVVKARSFKINMRVVAPSNGMVWYRTTSKKWIPSDFTNHPKSIKLSQLKKHTVKGTYHLTIKTATYTLKKAIINHQNYYYPVRAID